LNCVVEHVDRVDAGVSERAGWPGCANAGRATGVARKSVCHNVSGIRRYAKPPRQGFRPPQKARYDRLDYGGNDWRGNADNAAKPRADNPALSRPLAALAFDCA
jgi:hypothetical protein